MVFSAFTQAEPEALADDGHRGERLGVVHTGGTDHSDRTDPLSVDGVWRYNESTIGQRLHSGLTADGHVKAR